MNNEALHMIYKSVIIAKLLYASSAWWGFTTAIPTVSAWRHLTNEASALVCVSQMFQHWRNSADNTLFQRILCNPNNILHSLLPTLNATGHYLRHRRHNRVLPPKTGSLQHFNMRAIQGLVLMLALLTIHLAYF